jgi:hypothetical protein
VVHARFPSHQRQVVHHPGPRGQDFIQIREVFLTQLRVL